MEKFMKNKKNIVALMIAASFIASPVIASEQQTEKQKKSDVDTVVNVDKAAQYSDKYSEKQNKIMLIKQDLEYSQINEQIREIEAKENKSKYDAKLLEEQKKWNEEKKNIIAGYEKKIAKLKADADDSKKKALKKEEDDKKAVLDSVFVTRVSGIGSNMRARIYVNNSISTKSVGKFATEGVKIIGIDQEGVNLEYKGLKKYVPITTINRAQYKSFEQLDKNKNKSDNSQNNSSLGMSGFSNQAMQSMQSMQPMNMPIKVTGQETPVESSDLPLNDDPSLMLR